MRILIFSNAYKPSISGVVTSISLFRQALRHAGHTVSIIAPQYTGYQDDETDIFRFPAIDLTSQIDLSLAIPIKTFMERTVTGLMPDVIHSQHPVVMGDVAANFAQKLNVPLVFTYHTLYGEYLQKHLHIASEWVKAMMDQIIAHYLKQCNHIIAPTAAVYDLIQNRYHPTTPVSIIPTPVDLQQYRKLEPNRVRSKYGLERKLKILLYVGRLSEEKNLKFLLCTYARIARSQPQTRLMLVGKGPAEATLRKQTMKLNIAHQVIFTGGVPHDEIPHYAAAATCFVFPSQTETQGLVLIENMAAGTPVVAVASPPAMDILKAGGGIVTPPNEEAFAAAILHLLENHGERRRMGEMARTIAGQYDIMSATAALTEVYRQAIKFGGKQKR